MRSSSPCCDPKHLNPIHLPSLSEDIPGYYRDMIDQCRAKDPHERPAAWRLLNKFPPINQPENGQAEGRSREIFGPKSMGVDVARCDCCCRLTDHFLYHCNLCYEGLFDMCQNCFDSGLHCLDTDHLLVEMEISPGSNWPEAGNYYSSVRTSGVRDVIAP